MTQISDPKILAQTALKQIFMDRDPTAIDRFIGTYRQHNPFAADGREGLRAFVANIPADNKITVMPVRALRDGDLVALQCIYEGFGPPNVIFDVFRVRDDKLVEHWDCAAPVAPPNPSGHTQTDGPTEPTDLGATEANRALVTSFVETVLVGGDFSKLDSFISTQSYTQHNSQIADGLGGLAAAVEAMGKAGVTLAYSKLHRTIAEGNFVLTMSEGDFAGTHTAFYDLFRVEAGRIVEHWDVLQPIPAKIPHSNSMF